METWGNGEMGNRGTGEQGAESPSERRLKSVCTESVSGTVRGSHTKPFPGECEYDLQESWPVPLLLVPCPQAPCPLLTIFAQYRVVTHSPCSPRLSLFDRFVLLSIEESICSYSHMVIGLQTGRTGE